MAFTIECLGGITILRSSELTKYNHSADPNAFDNKVPDLEVSVRGFCQSQCVIEDDDGVRVICQAKNTKMGVERVKELVALALAVVVYRIGSSLTDTPQ